MTREKHEKAKKRFNQICKEYFVTIPVLSTLLELFKPCDYFQQVEFLELLISENVLEKKVL